MATSEAAERLDGARERLQDEARLEAETVAINAGERSTREHGSWVVGALTEEVGWVLYAKSFRAAKRKTALRAYLADHPHQIGKPLLVIPAQYAEPIVAKPKPQPPQPELVFEGL